MLLCQFLAMQTHLKMCLRSLKNRLSQQRWDFDDACMSHNGVHISGFNDTKYIPTLLCVEYFLTSQYVMWNTKLAKLQSLTPLFTH